MKTLRLDQLVKWHAEQTPNAPAVGSPLGWFSYAVLEQRVAILAAHLQSAGIDQGTVVLNLLTNSATSVAVGLAIQRCGGVLVEVHRDWGKDRIAKIVQTTQAHYAFAHAKDIALLKDASCNWQKIWTLRTKETTSERTTTADFPIEEFHEESWFSCAAPFTDVLAHDDQPGLVLFTSGSTGEPRGVLLSHNNIAANTRAIIEYLQLAARDRVLSILPLSYSYGRSLLQTHLWVGGSVFFDHRFMFPHTVLQAIASEQCTGFAGVPATFETLKQKCDPKGVAMPTLRYVTQAGGALSKETQQWSLEHFAPAEFFVMYGQTEATARLSYVPPASLSKKLGSIGIPIPGVELKIVDDGGRPLAEGETGHLVAAGPNITPGYLGLANETSEILHDGWLWTGDLGYRDNDGFFFLTGRKRSFMKVSGHRFSTAEVEQRLLQHPEIRETCVVSVPDAVTGEAVFAFVAPEPISIHEVRRFCSQTLPTYEVPKFVHGLPRLPLNTSGKVARPDLEVLARQIVLASTSST